MPLWSRWAVWTLDGLNRHGKAFACRLRGGIHPKHLIPDGNAHAWYLSAITPEDRVLDIGCGPGGHTLRVARHCWFVVGLDQDEQVLRLAEQRAEAAQVTNAYFRQMNLAGHLLVPEGWADAVLCLDVIEHLENRQGLLKQISRVLRPGGLLFISAPNRETSWRRRLQAAGLFSLSDPDHKVEYTRQEFVEELSVAGFALADAIRPTTLDTPWAGLQDVLGACWLPLWGWFDRRRRATARRRPWEANGFRAVGRKPLDIR